MNAMAEPGAKSRIIPIKVAASRAEASAEELRARLVRDGWMEQMSIGEPRLSELIEKYKKLGYEVRVESYEASCDDGNVDSDAGREMARHVGTVYVRKAKAGPVDDEPRES
jgi:hypothetical protein